MSTVEDIMTQAETANSSEAAWSEIEANSVDEAVLMPIQSATAQNAKALLNDAQGAVGIENGSLALGLSSISDWGTAMQFLDLMKMSRPFMGHEPNAWGGMTHEELRESGVLDANGWPTSIPDGVDKIGTLWAWDGEDADAASTREGIYVVEWDGEGTFSLPHARIISQEEGRMVIEVKGSGFGLDILETDPNGTGNYLRNITIVKEEYEALHDAGALFNPEWVDIIEDARQIRMMDWMDTNNSSVSEWADRPEAGDASYTYNGVPLEVMVKLANQVGSDVWFNMPHDATEEYIREFATYVRDNLDPNLKVTVEYSNEIWNYGFQQAKDLNAEGAELFGNADGYQSMLNSASMGIYQTMSIWTEVFGDETEVRLDRVVGTQTANSWVTEQLLTAPLWEDMYPETYVPVHTLVDSVAVTTYFGDQLVQKEEIYNAILDAINDPNVNEFDFTANLLRDPEVVSSLPWLSEALTHQHELAKSYDLDLVSYEGGQHVQHSWNVAGDGPELINAFLGEFLESPQMAELYNEVWEIWAAIGNGPFMQFGDVLQANSRSSFSMMKNLVDDDSLVYQLLTGLNETEEAWWEDRQGEQFQHGLVIEADGADSTLVGTSQEDFLLGGKGNDLLVGGKGDDGLNGKEGIDTVLVNGSILDYTLNKQNKGYILLGPDGEDYLYDIEQIQFEDGDLVKLVDFSAAKAMAEQKAGQTDPTIDDEAPGGDTGSQQNDGSSTDQDLPKSIEIKADDHQLIDLGISGGKAILGSAQEKGITVLALNKWSAIGKELGLNDSLDTTAYSVSVTGSKSELNGHEFKADYWSLNDGVTGHQGVQISESALEVAQKVGSIVLNAEVLVGSDYADHFSGREDDDFFFGGDGHDVLLGGSGNDVLHGGKGDDFIAGHYGDDTYDGGDGDDRLEILAGGNNEVTGGSGSDEFIIHSDIETVRITDFTLEDELTLIGLAEGESEADIFATAVQDDSDIVFAFGEGQVVLEGLDLSTFSFV